MHAMHVAISSDGARSRVGLYVRCIPGQFPIPELTLFPELNGHEYVDGLGLARLYPYTVHSIHHLLPSTCILAYTYLS